MCDLLIRGDMAAQRHWQNDVVSLAPRFWGPLRGALRADIHGAMDIVGLKQLSFAQQIESMDRRQLDRFVAAIAAVRYLSVDESAVVSALEAQADSGHAYGFDGEPAPVWASWIGSFCVAYLLMCRTALGDRYELGYEEFGLQQQGFAQLLLRTPVGDLLALERGFCRRPCLTVDVGVATGFLLDLVITGADEQSLFVCRMAHAMASPSHPAHFDLAAGTF